MSCVLTQHCKSPVMPGLKNHTAVLSGQMRVLQEKKLRKWFYFKLILSWSQGKSIIAELTA